MCFSGVLGVENGLKRKGKRNEGVIGKKKQVIGAIERVKKMKV